MNSVLIFAYGTLQEEIIQLELLNRKLSGEKDLLSNFILDTINFKVTETDVSTYLIAVATHSNMDSISGTVYEIQEQDLKTLDAYEGPSYERSLVKLGSGRKAFVYHKPEF